MKKLFALLLTMAMIFSLATVAFADDETGTITIKNLYTSDNSSFTAKYDVYRIFDLTSYSTEGKGAYSYVINKDWEGFFAKDSDAWNYVEKNELGYIVGLSSFTKDNAPEFAELAIAYAQTNKINPVRSSAIEGQFVINGNNGTFSDLPLGYYLVDSDVGALCGLTTTNPNANIVAKNGVPTIDKQVKEDSTENFTDHNSADIGQTMEFQTTINVHAGAQNYVLHDKMTNMEFLGVTLVTLNGVETDAYEVRTQDTTEKACEHCTFEVWFDNDFVDDLVSNDKIIVNYQAKLTVNAVIAGEGNKNVTKLEFGEKKYTSEDSTTSSTYGFDIAKTDSQNILLDGAKFKIYDAETAGKEIPVVPVMGSDGKQVVDEEGRQLYRRALAGEPGEEIVVTGGLIRVIGFDNGIYYLEEIKAPEGYNELKTRQKFTIADGNLDAILTTKNDGKIEVSTGSGVHVVNKAGTMLPETGAMGTTMFIVFGMFVMLATGVLLVTKKRMSMIED